MMYRNMRGWWRVLTLALTLGAAVAEIVSEGRRRRQRVDERDQIHNWENEGGAPPPSPSGERP